MLMSAFFFTSTTSCSSFFPPKRDEILLEPRTNHVSPPSPFSQQQCRQETDSPRLQPSKERPSLCHGRHIQHVRRLHPWLSPQSWVERQTRKARQANFRCRLRRRQGRAACRCPDTVDLVDLLPATFADAQLEDSRVRFPAFAKTQRGPSVKYCLVICKSGPQIVRLTAGSSPSWPSHSCPPGPPSSAHPSTATAVPSAALQ